VIPVEDAAIDESDLTGTQLHGLTRNQHGTASKSGSPHENCEQLRLRMLPRVAH